MTDKYQNHVSGQWDLHAVPKSTWQNTTTYLEYLRAHSFPHDNTHVGYERDIKIWSWILLNLMESCTPRALLPNSNTKSSVMVLGYANPPPKSFWRCEANKLANLCDSRRTEYIPSHKWSILHCIVDAWIRYYNWIYGLLFYNENVKIQIFKKEAAYSLKFTINLKWLISHRFQSDIIKWK